MAANGRQSPNTHFPTPSDTDDIIVRAGFKVTTRKLPILSAKPIEEMKSMLKIAVPEMIFGDNFVRIEHLTTGWAISFSAFDALDRVDKTGASMLQVAHSKEWQSTRYRLVRPLARRSRSDGP